MAPAMPQLVAAALGSRRQSHRLALATTANIWRVSEIWFSSSSDASTCSATTFDTNSTSSEQNTTTTPHSSASYCSAQAAAVVANNIFWAQWTESSSGSVCRRKVIGSLFESSLLAGGASTIPKHEDFGPCNSIGEQKSEHSHQQHNNYMYFDAVIVDDSTSAKEAMMLLRENKQQRTQGHTTTTTTSGEQCTSSSETAAVVPVGTPAKNNSRVLIYRGHYGNALQLLSALQRRWRKMSTTTPSSKHHRPQHHATSAAATAATTTTGAVQDEWRRHRKLAQQEAASVNRLLIEIVSPTLSEGVVDSSRRSHDLMSHVVHAPIATVERVLQQLFAEQRDSEASAASTIDKTSASVSASHDQERSSYLIPLREILARIGSDQWRRKGVYISQLENFIHPTFGVYPPTRQEYLDLLPHHLWSNQQRPIQKILDVGTGTGILAAIALHRHPGSVAVGTDINPRAIQCARENMERMGFQDRVQLYETSLFPPSSSTPAAAVVVEPVDLLLCNPPWIPDAVVSDGAVAGSWMDRAIYDDMESSMLNGVLDGAAEHLRDNHSEVWLILSDLAEHLKLRSREEMLQRVHDGGLEIVETRAAKKMPVSSKRTSQAQQQEEMLFPRVAEARRAETTFLYRLRKR